MTCLLHDMHVVLIGCSHLSRLIVAPHGQAASIWQCFSTLCVRLLWHQEGCLYQIVYTQRYHCSQNCTYKFDLHCHYIKNVLILGVLMRSTSQELHKHFFGATDMKTHLSLLLPLNSLCSSAMAFSAQTFKKPAGKMQPFKRTGSSSFCSSTYIRQTMRSAP